MAKKANKRKPTTSEQGEQVRFESSRIISAQCAKERKIEEVAARRRKKEKKIEFETGVFSEKEQKRTIKKNREKADIWLKHISGLQNTD